MEFQVCRVQMLCERFDVVRERDEQAQISVLELDRDRQRGSPAKSYRGASQVISDRDSVARVAKLA
jgi:hypothetical protein